MFPYMWGSMPVGSMGVTAGILPIDLPGFHDLPEEVRAALEERQNEIHSEADMRRLVDELMLRR